MVRSPFPSVRSNKLGRDGRGDLAVLPGDATWQSSCARVYRPSNGTESARVQEGGSEGRTGRRRGMLQKRSQDSVIAAATHAQAVIAFHSHELKKSPCEQSTRSPNLSVAFFSGNFQSCWNALAALVLCGNWEARGSNSSRC